VQPRVVPGRQELGRRGVVPNRDHEVSLLLRLRAGCVVMPSANAGAGVGWRPVPRGQLGGAGIGC
jgi:hypothetical protein